VLRGWLPGSRAEIFMIVCVQRCARASVRIDGQLVGSIDAGLVVLVGVEKGDDDERAETLADRLVDLRIFEDDEGKMNRSARDVDADVLIVSQFTLTARLDRGRRPSFDHAAPPAEARALYEQLVERVRAAGLRTATGVFGARMEVELVNDGPVTFVIEQR
jgi:D-aminoacyl-tRNA deacylase